MSIDTKSEECEALIINLHLILKLSEKCKDIEEFKETLQELISEIK